jgi:hypothetical protein
MKIITVMQGTAARRVPPDDIVPKPVPPVQDIIAAVQQRYQFSNSPPMQGLSSQCIFHAGKFTHNGVAHAINQLIMEGNGDLVATSSTDIADLILDDLFQFLDEKFNYQLQKAPPVKSYVSVIIVQFDFRLEERIRLIGAIADIVNSARGPGKNRFELQRLSFGGEQKTVRVPMLGASQIELVENAEYVVERRAGYPLEQNRYFCSAPLTTADHLRSLENIEATILRNPV